jgi:predicted ferric reductase
MIRLDAGAARNRRLALLIAASSYSITLLYLLYGGTSQGKQWFRSLIPNDDSNGAATLLIVFTAPIFVASVAAILLLKADGGSATDIEDREINCNTDRIRTQQHLRCCNNVRQAVKRILASQRLFTVTLVIVPCLIFFACVVQRHYTEEYSKEITAWRWDLLHHISNACAITGLVAFANLLIPVSKNSPLVELLNWTPQEALLMHKYAGRLAIIGITLHGFGHLIHAYWRWWTLFVGGSIDELSSTQSRQWMEKSFWRGLMPPRECWQQQFSSDQSTHLDFGPGCINDDISCSCDDFWINFTGSIGLIASLALACGSVNYIRRHHYRVFYVVHITAGPLFILAAMLHYKRTILYICPSLLYYASTSVPVYLDSWLSRRRYNGSKIISVSKIPCPSHQRPNGNVLSIEFEASIDTMSKFQPEPGSYCTLQVPSLSLVAHPFTVNIVPGQANRMRMLVRQVGPFTTQLVDLLESSSTHQHETSSFTEEKKECCDIESQSSFISLPKMHINLYGTSSLRSKQIYHHDSALIIAAGIGITPYLSLMMKIAASSEANCSLKSVTLHWVCRDAGLIRFVHEHYFAAIQEKFNVGGGGSASIRIITHYTGSNNEANLFNYGLEAVHYQIDPQEGSPVQSSFYYVSNNRSLITFVSIFGVGVVEVLRAGCIVGLLAICTISIVLSVVSYLVFNNDHHTQKANRKPMSTGESYGSQENTRLNNNFSYECHAEGRPSEATLLSSLKDSENPGLFLCGPSSMMKQLLSFLSTSNHKDTAVYEEIFEV